MVDKAVPYSGAPTVESGGGGGNQLGVRANANDFGGQIAEATQNLGQELGKTSDIASQQAIKASQMATDAATNDVIANQWGPTVSKLSNDYRTLQGKRAVDAYQPYVETLQKTRAQLLEGASNPMMKAQLDAYTSRHMVSEIDSATRWQDVQMTAYEDNSANAFVASQTNIAASNYNDPQTVMGAKNAADAQILKHGLDRGVPMESIRQQQGENWGKTVQTMVGRALASGDIKNADAIYTAHQNAVPGYMRDDIEKTLHSENMKTYGNDAATALLAGKPVPAYGGTGAQEVRNTVSATAQSSGVDVNHALTIASIESNFGQNTGKRGDIGQTGKPGNLQEQAQNLVDEAKKAQTVADKALGRPALPYEQYICYQQGAGGGPALLKAASDPNAKAVDVLAPLYKTRELALQAVQNNGGNASMSCGQFVDFLRRTYDAKAARVAVGLPAQQPVQGAQEQISPELATAMNSADNAVQQKPATALPETAGIAMQPGATPVQALNNFDQVYSEKIQIANQIPNLDQREAVLKALAQQHSTYQIAAQAWKTQFVNKAQQLAMDPKFTSTNQIPPDMMSALADSPETMNYLQTRANYNLEHGSGVVTKDMREYGSGFYELFKKIHAPSDDPDRVHDVTQLYSHVGPDGDLTMSGLDKLTKEISGKGTPDGDSESAMRGQAFKVIKTQISGEDQFAGLKDPKGEEIYARALPLMYKAIEDGKSKGIPASELYDPSNKNYIGNAVQGLKRTPAEYYNSLAAANLVGDGKTVAIPGEDAATKSRLESGLRDKTATLKSIQDAYSSGKISKQTAMQLAIAGGYAQARDSEQPSVPRPE